MLSHILAFGLFVKSEKMPAKVFEHFEMLQSAYSIICFNK